MGLSLACSSAEGHPADHDLCLRANCECICHANRPHLILEAERARLRLEGMKPRLPPPAPPRARRRHMEGAEYDEDGRRICPVCRLPFVRPPGPGRYPKVHPECAALGVPSAD